jgi:hypothetical protein
MRSRSSSSKMRSPPDRLCGALRDDPQLLLRLGERRLDVEPGLPPVFEAIERADTRIRHAGGGREFVSHVVSLRSLYTGWGSIRRAK